MSFRINTVTIDGNLTRDPELRALPSGTAVCNLRIAHNSRRKNGDSWEDVPNYFDVTVWGGVGEWVANNLSKGAKVVVQGELRWREYKDKHGNDRQAVDINAQSIVAPGGKGGGGGAARGSDVPADTADFSIPGDPYATAGAKADDDIPF